jgi:hypothetical protein
VTKPLEVHHFVEGDQIDIKYLLAPAVVEGHEVTEPTMLWVANSGGPATVTVMQYGWNPKKPGDVITEPKTITVRRRRSPDDGASETLIGMFAPGPIKYDRHFRNLTVCAFRFDPKPG